MKKTILSILCIGAMLLSQLTALAADPVETVLYENPFASGYAFGANASYLGLRRSAAIAKGENIRYNLSQFAVGLGTETTFAAWKSYDYPEAQQKDSNGYGLANASEKNFYYTGNVNDTLIALLPTQTFPNWPLAVEINTPNTGSEGERRITPTTWDDVAHKATISLNHPNRWSGSKPDIFTYLIPVTAAGEDVSVAPAAADSFTAEGIISHPYYAADMGIAVLARSEDGEVYTLYDLPAKADTERFLHFKVTTSWDSAGAASYVIATHQQDGVTKDTYAAFSGSDLETVSEKTAYPASFQGKAITVFTAYYDKRPTGSNYTDGNGKTGLTLYDMTVKSYRLPEVFHNVTVALTAEEGASGTVTYQGNSVTNGQTLSVKEGTDLVLTVTPAEGSQYTVTADGQTIEQGISEKTVTLSNITGAKNVTVAFAKRAAEKPTLAADPYVVKTADQRQWTMYAKPAPGYGYTVSNFGVKLNEKNGDGSALSLPMCNADGTPATALVQFGVCVYGAGLETGKTYQMTPYISCTDDTQVTGEVKEFTVED